MSNPAHPAWPDPAALPFSMFGFPGASAGAGASAVPAGGGLAGGMDLLRRFWGALPGGSAVPGFLVPTVDVEELDKRISDLRAAESWLEVNLNMLRATVQGLEVQRHTIAALHSLSAMADGSGEPKAAPATGGLPAGWPMPQGAPASAARPAPAAASPARAEAAPPESDANGADAGDAGSDDKDSDASGAAPGVLEGFAGGLAANQWLGFLQEQFARVAQAATASPAAPGASPAASRKTARKAAPRKAAGAAGTAGRRPAAKTAGRKRAPAR